MPTNTLTSLAILKVNIDQGNDYLDYLYPFILQVLVDHDLDPIRVVVVGACIREQFGLEIPQRTIELLLKRIARKGFVERDSGVYRKSGDLPNPQLASKQAEAKRHIEAVLAGLQQFSQETINPISSDEEAVVTICTFLAAFDVTCLRAYLRGTAIPEFGGEHQTDIVLVSDYIQQVLRTNPERFASFLILVQGHMLANALMCPDLAKAPRTYRDVTFYLDTPLLIQSLGSEGEDKQAAIHELITLVRRLGGKVAAFSHSRDELQSVLRGATLYLESPQARGAVVFEARRRGVTKSDLLLFASSVDDKLSEADIEVDNSPRYVKEFQIDETIFEQVLEDEVSYYNPRAREYDINSVRSIYAIRGNTSAPSVEKARAVFVTSNTGFAKAAWEYGQRYEPSQNVSSVITDFTLANMAWLKEPMGASSVPTTQLLAFSYAALAPSGELLDKYLREIDRLENQGTITEQDHQVLRSSPFVYPELMHLTLGQDAALTTETITKTLERVSSEIKKEESKKLMAEQQAHQETLDVLNSQQIRIKKEESKKLMAEQQAHQETLDVLNSQQIRNQRILSNVYWQCRDRARVFARIVSWGMGVLLGIGLLAGWGLRSTSPFVSSVLMGAFGISSLFTLANLVVGSTVKDLHDRLQNRCLIWLLKRESKTFGVDLSEFDTN